MSWVNSELRLLGRSKLSVYALILLACLSALSVWFGMQEIKKQQQTISEMFVLHKQDVALVSNQFKDKPDGGDAGDAAYYTFYYTWDLPSNSAFAALGLRDVAPYLLRIRALGLQAQLYDGEIFNPELALPGRFDFAFVLIYLSPLFVIALMHDLISSERQAGRLRLLLSLPEFGKKRWVQRVFLRYFLVALALLLPFSFGSILSAMSLATFLSFILISLAYLAFWFGLSLLIATRSWASVTNATTLVGLWVVLTLILPTVSNIILTRSIPVAQGVDLMLIQRQNVHSAWEIPREETMQKFFKNNSQWQNTAPLPTDFHWKWYFAFHQLGDESVDALFKEYRQGLMERQQWTDRLGWILPSVATQSALHRLANTDLNAQLNYQDQIIGFHQQIREFYYTYLFNDHPFTLDDFAKQPIYQPQKDVPTHLNRQVLPLLLLSLIIFIAGIKMIRSQKLS